MYALRPPSDPPDAKPRTPLSPESPLQTRIWHLFCQGYSHTAIGEQVGLERHAVARHVHTVEAILAREHVDDLSLARHRALEAAYNLLAVAMSQLDVESNREDALWREYEHAPNSAAMPGDAPVPPAPATYYRAGRSRLLGVALAALRHAIRLSGLEDGTRIGGFTPNLADLMSPYLPPAPASMPPFPASSSPDSGPAPAVTAPLPRQPSFAARQPESDPAGQRHAIEPSAEVSHARTPPAEKSARHAVAPRPEHESAPAVSTPVGGTKWNMLPRLPAPRQPAAGRPRAPTARRKPHGRR